MGRKESNELNKLPLWDSVIVLFCCTILCVHSSFAIISMGKRELVALLSLSSWCFVIVVWLFLSMPRVCLQFVIVVFPDHTRLQYLTRSFFFILCLPYLYKGKTGSAPDGHVFQRVIYLSDIDRRLPNDYFLIRYDFLCFHVYT